MLYALTRNDGSTAITYVIPKTITVDGKTLPVTLINSAEKFLTALDEGAEDPDDTVRTFPLPSDDMRTYEVNSVPGAVLTFHDIGKVVAEYPDPIVAYEKITVDDLPKTRVFREAWTVSGKSVTVNLAKAKEITRNRLREERKPMLEVLDVAYQRADEQDDGPLKRRIAADKQKLRDITANPLIEQAATPEALQALTVEYLLAHP
jgi:hypothetical protein